MPEDMPDVPGLAGPEEMMINALDGIYSDFASAAKASGPGAWSAWAKAGLTTAGTIGAAIPGVGPIAKMAAAPLGWLLEKLGQRSEYNAARAQFERCKKLEVLLRESLQPPAMQGRIVSSVTVERLPAYADCNNPADIRRRTVVTPQNEWAPWTFDLNKAGVAFPEARGNCGKGFALKGCGSPPGTGNSHRRRAGGSPCSGGAQFTALLWPWWCGNGPPRPAPFVKRGELQKDVNGLLQALQSAMLRDPVVNAQLDIQKIIDMERDLGRFTGSDMRIRNAGGQSFHITLAQVEAAQALCAAAVNARVSFLKSKGFMKRIESYISHGNRSIDPELYAAFGVPAPGQATATQPGTMPPRMAWPPLMIPVPFPGRKGWFIFVQDPELNKKSAKLISIQKPKRGSFSKKEPAKKPKLAREIILAKKGEPVFESGDVKDKDAKPDDLVSGKKSSAAPVLIAGAAAVALMAMKKK